MRRRSTDVAVALLFVVLSIGMTWPLVRNLTRAVSDFGDPYLNACYLDWDIYAATHPGTRLFDAPVLYPHRNALAFSEHLCGLAVFAAPLRWLGAGPITAANILWILGFAFTGFGTYVLGRMVTGSAGAGIVAGIFAAFVPWRFGQLSHLQIAWAGWLPLMIAALLHFGRQRTWRNAAIFGAVFFMNGWTNLHFFVLGSFAIALSTPIVLRRDDRAYLKIAASTAVAIVMLLPFLLPYRAAMKQYGMRGNVAETRQYSATARDWLYVPDANRFYAPQQTDDGPDEPERLLFPGYLAPLLAAAAILMLGRRIGDAGWIGILWTALGFFGSFGLNGWLHSLLFNALGVFRGIRVPARWAVIAYVGIALLAAIGVHALARVRVVYALLAAALLFELHAAPIRWYLAPRDTPAVYSWLRTAPMRGGVAHLPFGNAVDEYLYMLHETAHHRPMLNGRGFVPPSTAAITALAQKDPIPDALMDHLEVSKCSLLIVHADRVIGAGDFLRHQVANGRLVFIRRFDGGTLGDYVFAVRKNEPDAKPGPTDVVQRYLGGVRERSAIPIGYVEVASPLVRGRLLLGGWAIAPGGVAKVTLWFQHHTIAIPAVLGPRPDVAKAFSAYAPFEVTGFGVNVPRRPDVVREETDYEIEITGRDGSSTLLADRWLTWTP